MQKQQQSLKKKSQPVSKEWNEKSVNMTLRKAHSKNLISISPLSQNLFYTSSEDNTIRMWDLRLGSSVKLIQSQQFKNNKSEFLSNCENDLKDLLFVGFQKNVYSFDIRKEQIFVNKVQNKSTQQHFDDISYLKFSSKLQQLAVADDQGDIRLYKPDDLSQIGRMDQFHNNICNSIDFMYPEKLKSPLCISGGFDCRLIQWNMIEHTPIKELDMNQVFTKYQIHATNTMPFIYHIFCYQNSIIASLQSGHVICTTWNQIRKPKFIMQANLTKIIQTKIFQYKNLTSMICLNGDQSFSLFDFIKRDGGCPTFLQKYSIPFQGSWIEPIGDNTILVAGYDPSLAIYKIKN